jgi:rhodanese-related sulfurtransferase
MSIFQKLFSDTPKINLKPMVEEGAFLVDVRTPGEFSEGHVAGSVNIPLENVIAELPKFQNKKNIIVFCRSGNRSGQAKSILEQHGITGVVNGGAWEDVNTFVKQD